MVFEKLQHYIQNTETGKNIRDYSTGRTPSYKIPV